VGDRDVDPDIASKLGKLLAENVESCDGFRNQMAAEFDLGEDFQVGSLSRLRTEDSFVLGFAKWLVTNALGARLSVTVRSVLTYKVAPSSDGDDMVAIAFRLSPFSLLAADRTEIATAITAPSSGDLECAQATKIPARVSHRKSVDEELQSPGLLEKYLTETESMLEIAGYDISEYRGWATP
jgi:hypothetical protein